MLIDCHAHLYPPQFDAAELDAAVDSAAAAGVAAIIAVPESLRDCDAVLDVARRHAHIVAPAIGLHPVQPEANGCAAHSVSLEQLPGVEALLRAHAHEAVCVGEVGLDFSPHVLSRDEAVAGERREAQRAVFARQVQLANELGLPLNVHSRSAGHHAIEVLRREGCAHGALLHAFDGKARYAMEALPLGCVFSVPACIVRSASLRKLVAALPLDALVLESDSPALPAVQGERNVPASIAVAAAEVAAIKGLTVQEVVAATGANAMRLFPRLHRVLARRRCSDDGSGGDSDDG